ncbi:unnamed protein product [Boreogadus saida]
MTITFLALIITFTVVSGASNSDKVHQTPPEMVVAIESRAMATLKCFHSIKDYNRILWYKQQRNDKLQFLGNIKLINTTDLSTLISSYPNPPPASGATGATLQ